MKKKMSRREFVALGGGMMGVLAAGGRPGFAATASQARVVLVRASDRKKGVRRLIELFGANPVRGKSVLVKPNFNTADIPPGSTHNDTLQELLKVASDWGAKALSIGDRSGPEPIGQVLQKKGIAELAKPFNAAVINFDALGEGGYVKFTPPGSHWKDGFLVARPVTESECIVSTCCIKTHGFGGVFTMSLKNSVGIVPRTGHPYMHELHNNPDQRRMIAEINCAYAPALIIVDGLEVFTDGGPMTGTRKTAEVFLAGTDRIAIDAVALAVLKQVGSNQRIMETSIFAQEQIARAVELKLGVARPDDILIVTGDPESEAYAKLLRLILAAG